MKKSILALFMLLIGITSFGGDLLILTNEMAFDGKVTRIDDCTVVFKSNGEKYLIPTSDIFALKFEDPGNKIYSKFMEMSDDDPDKCLSGRLDAENYHGKKGGHFVLGVLFGPFAMIGPALSNPTPERGKDTFLLSKNKEQFGDLEYLSCYKKKAKGQLIGAEALGWAAWILLALTL